MLPSYLFIIKSITMENRESIIDDHQYPVRERPVFITVLCILSYIGNGFLILSSLMMLLMTGFFRNIWNLALENGEAMEEAGAFTNVIFDKMLLMLDYMPLMGAVGLVAALINLLGVFRMWNLKRSGFYIYSVTELLPVLFNLVIYTMILGAMGLFMSIFNLIIPVLFVILYGLNLKYMKKGS
jgi:hypothetical protein